MNFAVPSSSALSATAAAFSDASTVRRWTITMTTGETISGRLPAWATDDPSENGVLPEELAARLADINYSKQFPGQVLRVYSPASRDGRSTPVEVLHSSIDCNPYAPDPDPRTPVANIHLAGECWLTDLGPGELGQLAKGLRVVADRLDHDVIPALIDARTEWAAHHSHATHHSHTPGNRP